MTAGEVILCGGAFNSPQLLQVSGVGDADHLRRVGVEVRHHLPGRRRPPAGPPRGLRPARLHAAGLDATRRCRSGAWPWIGLQWLARARPGRVEPLRGRRLHPQQRRRRLPEPDVPLPAHRRALRRLGARRPGTATRCTSGRCTPTRRGSVRITSPDAGRQAGAALQLPVDRRRTAASGWRRSATPARILGQPAFAPFDGGELSPGPAVATDDEILAWVARDAETALHPSCTCRMGVDDESVRRPGDDARARAATASGSSTPRRCRTSRTATSTPR